MVNTTTVANKVEEVLNPSTSSIVTALVFNGSVFAISLAAFIYLRPKQIRIYQPRAGAATINETDRPRPLRTGFYSWIIDLLTRKDSEILRDAGLDGYFFLRYLRVAIIICAAGVVVLYPILLVINGTGGNNLTGFDLLTFGNVKNQNRYYAHALLSWVFFGFVIFTLYREQCYYVGVRQAVLTSPFYSNLVSSRSILIGTVPSDYLTPESISSLFDGVKHVWINRNYSKLSDKVSEREALASKIEAAETKLIRRAFKNRLRSERKGKNQIEGQNIDEYVPQNKRPKHRLKPVIGKKVDTIDYSSEKLEEINHEIRELRQAAGSFAPLNSAFVTFNTQLQAETAFHALAHHQALQLCPKYIGVRPDDIFWPNLRLFWWERLFRSAGAMGAIVALCIFWAIPVAFIGTLSNVNSLTDKIHFLRFINHLPDVILGIITSLLPSLLLAGMMSLLPAIIRILTIISGRPTETLIQYYIQNSFFAFQVIQVFLITTVFSAAVSVVTKVIQQPPKALDLLSSNLPKASNFYISYFLLQGPSVCGAMFLQITTLMLFHVLRAILDTTPRKIWNRWNVLEGVGWGFIFPVYTNLVVIAVSYSLISPIVLVFAGLAFALIYFGYLHNLMFITLPTDGRGIYYPRAIYQTFVGLYLAQICLLGLYAVSKAWGPLALEGLIFGVTIFVHYNMQVAFAPLRECLPQDLLRAAETSNRVGESTIDHSGTVQNLEPTASTSAAGITSTEKSLLQTNESLEIDRTTTAVQSDLEKGNVSKPFAGVGTGLSIFTRYFKPHQYLTPAVLARDFLPSTFHEPPPPISVEEESQAFCHPSIRLPDPVIWLPRDPWGLSSLQVEALRARGVEASDESAWFETNQKKKKAILNVSHTSDVPIYNHPIKY